MRYAVGIIHHPVTGRWQPWIYTEDAETMAFACISSHANKAQAHLVARIILQAYQTHGVVEPEAMRQQSRESEVPDPLPQPTLDALLAAISQQADDVTNDTILEI
jgi:hypothetical protein